MRKSWDSLPWILRVILQFFFGFIISIIYRIVGLNKKNGTLNLVIVVLLYILFSPILWWVDFLSVLLFRKFRFFV